MQLTKLGHAALLLEIGQARLLIDPGTYSHGFEDLRGLTGILITHQHADHLDPARIHALVAANPDALVLADAATTAVLAGLGIAATAASAGDTFEPGVLVEVVGQEHAVIHPDIPVVPNVGYLVAERLLHPGDALTVPDRPVELLALPMMAPWMRVADAVDYARAVHPAVVVPIHDALLADPRSYHKWIDQLGPAGTRLAPADGGEPVSF
ncbi:MAG TPA: MBL fold metallo-hydrolase [Actinomycetes bacterium]|nr:MBL fold metallo-hydrolase [Actinomycetes bacterium]